MGEPELPSASTGVPRRAAGSTSAASRLEPAKPLDWRFLLEIGAGVAGLTVVVAFVGAVLLWIRFDELGLAADRILEVLPRELLITVGARTLFWPIVAGVAAVLVLFLLNPLDQNDQPTKRLPITLGLILGGVALLLLLIPKLDFLTRIVPLLALAGAAILVIFVTAKNTHGFRPVGWIVFASFVLVGGALTVLRTQVEPKMEPVAVLLKDGKPPLAGFYVGQADGRIYLAPMRGGDPSTGEVSAAPVHDIVSLDRAQVERFALMKPAGLDAHDEGRGEAQLLLEDLVADATPASEGLVATAEPERTFAPLAHIHDDESIPPVSAEQFLNNSALTWAHDGCKHYVFGPDDHLPSDRRGEGIGKFDPKRLKGAKGYSHVAADKRCADVTGPRFSTEDFTRPAEKGHPHGVPPGEGFYLDLDNSKRRPRATIIGSAMAKELIGTPAYYEKQPSKDGGRLRITYWLFYPLSQPPGNPELTKYVVHEGDWERVGVLLERVGRGDVWRPMTVTYHTHDEHEDVPWRSARRVAEASEGPRTHPVAFVARGSHASYSQPGRVRSLFKVAGVRVLPVTDFAKSCPACPRWFTWKLLRDVTKEPWYGFGGAWGELGKFPYEGTLGPLGPSRYKRGSNDDAPEDLLRQTPHPK